MKTTKEEFFNHYSAMCPNRRDNNARSVFGGPLNYCKLSAPEAKNYKACCYENCPNKEHVDKSVELINNTDDKQKKTPDRAKIHYLYYLDYSTPAIGVITTQGIDLTNCENVDKLLHYHNLNPDEVSYLITTEELELNEVSGIITNI